MFGNIGLNHVRNALSGFLCAYGAAAFLLFLLLVIYWARVSPSTPDPRHGYIFPHSEHGAITYFNAFQGTSCALLFAISISFFFLSAFIVPKRYIVCREQSLNFRVKSEKDDPAGLFRIGSICGTVAAPTIFFILGPPLVTWLNAMGFVLSFG